MVAKTSNYQLLKPSETDFYDINVSNSNMEIIDGELKKRIVKTTSSLTYYIRSDGNDANSGTTNDANGSFRTISKAISLLPEYLAHDVMIYISNGTYNESIILSGKIGIGTIYINGDNSVSANVTVDKIQVFNCKCQVYLSGINLVSTEDYLLNCYNSSFISANYMNIINANSNSNVIGVQAIISEVSIADSVISNTVTAISAGTGGSITSVNNSGSLNEISLKAKKSGRISTSGIQPDGTTKKIQLDGGLIINESSGVDLWGGWINYSSVTDLGLNKSTCTYTDIASALPVKSKLICQAPNESFSQGVVPYNYFKIIAEKHLDFQTTFILDQIYADSNGVSANKYQAYYYNDSLTARWSGWNEISSSFKVYSRISDLGLVATTCTPLQISQAMQDKSILETTVEFNANLPVNYAHLKVSKINRDAVRFEVFARGSDKGRFFLGTLDNSDIFSGWVEVFHNGNYGAVITKSTSASLTLADSNKVVAMIGSSAKTITIPDFASVPFPSGTQITFLMVEAGSVTFAPAGGVIIVSKDAKRTIDGQFASATLVKVFADSWVLIGSLKA